MAATTHCWAILGDVPLDLVVVVVVWYFIGVASICTTKMLADRGVPPLVLTFQQLLLGSTILRIYLGVMGDVQPLPKPVQQKLRSITVFRRRRGKEIKQTEDDPSDDEGNDNDDEEAPLPTKNQPKSNNNSTAQAVVRDESLYIHFGLMGILDGLDFLSTAIGFTMANASFVETIKSSQPITTTAVALLFGIDTLQFMEAVAMAVIVVGVFCSTVGNASSSNKHVEEDNIASISSDGGAMTMAQSVHTAMIGVTANLMFAFRVNAQKKFRAHPDGKKMNDTNMLMWMQRIGSLALTIPILMGELPGILQQTSEATLWGDLLPFGLLVLINAICFSLYTLTNTYVLSRVSVGQHTGLNALRRMFVIVFTAIAFGVPITPMKTVGILLCFSGFSAFSYYRNRPSTVMTDGKADPDENSELDSTPLINNTVVTSTSGSDEGNPVGRSMWSFFLRNSNNHEHRT